MLKKIIIVENSEEVQCDTLEEVVETLIDKNYYNMTQNQKIERMKIKALANCINNKMEIVQELPVNFVNNLENKFIINDEITYIYSLLITNNILLLEKKNSNIFTENLNKEKFKDNYIIVNTFAKELLGKYIVGNI